MIPYNLAQPGDLLTYGPLGLAGFIIRIKTWHPICHVECYVGDKLSVASRDGIGVGEYFMRLGQLNGIYRPNQPFDLVKSMSYFKTVEGQKYDWIGLLCFTTFVSNGSKNKQFCSEFLTNFYRAGDLQVIATHERAVEIAPFELAESPMFDRIWASEDILKLDKEK